MKPFVAKVVKNGNSYHISIPSYIRKYMDIEQGDVIDIEKVTLIKEKIKNALYGILSRDSQRANKRNLCSILNLSENALF